MTKEEPQLRQITREDIEFLAALQNEMNTQPHVGQADPRFWVVMTHRLRMTLRDEDIDYVAITSEDGELIEELTLSEAVRRAKEAGISDNGWICIVGTRESGKTTRLLELSAQSGVPIAVRDVIHATWLRRYMSQCGIDAPDPIVVGRGIYEGGRFTSIEFKRDSDGMVPVLIDDVRAFFGDMGIRAEAVTIDADAVNFEFAIKANPTLVNCLRVWRNCKKGGKE